MRRLVAAAIACALLAPASAFASEEAFLKSIEDRWTGGGIVLQNLGGPKVNVSCNMQSTASAQSHSMDGSCRALLVVTQL